MLTEPQVYPCIYATKGFKANEHRYVFVERLDPSSGSLSAATLDALAEGFDAYAQTWRTTGPMTSLVVLTTPSNAAKQDNTSLTDDRKRFWDLLRAISDRDPTAWPSTIPEDVTKPAWTLSFRGERFVALALTPRYQLRQSRYCDSFVLAFQPIAIFQDLLATPEKQASAVSKVRALTDSLDGMPYSLDVIAVGDGKQSVSTMFFLSDNEESWGSLHSTIRSR